MGKVDSILYEFHLSNGFVISDDVSSNISGATPSLDQNIKSHTGSMNGGTPKSNQDQQKKVMQAKNFEEVV